MRITTRLTLISAATLVALVALILALGYSFSEFRRAKADYQLADQIQDNFVERTSIRDQYLLYREDRTQAMWEQRKEVADRLLRRARQQYGRKEDLRRLDQLCRHLDENTAIFHRIVANTLRLNDVNADQPAFRELDKRLTSQLLLKATAVRMAAASLQEATGLRVDQTFRRLATIVSLFGIAVALTTILATRQINRTIRRRLGPLHEGLTRVAEGDLEHRIGDTGPDEFGELARCVNAMADKLQSSTRQLGEEISQRLVLQAKQESEEKYHALVDNLSSGVVVHGPDTAVQFSNPMARSLLGLTEDQIGGRTALDPRWSFLRDDGSVMPAEEFPVNRVMATGAGLQGQVVGVCRPDAERPTWVLCNAFPTRDEQGAIIQAVVTFNDITERRLMEEEQAKLQMQLQQAQKMDSLGSLAGGVAHDMNNVLGAILGLSSAHLDIQPANSPAYRAFETITRAASRGRDLVKGLLGFARRSLAEATELDLNTILKEEVRLLERTTLAKVHLDMELDEDLRPIKGDASALTHAFMNLCVNAVEAMPTEGTLTLRTRNVDNAWIEVEVEDSGSGMCKDVLDRALDPFFTTKEVGKGTGLGLPLVYSTVKAHQGQMDIQSVPGRGTCVRLRFPACVHAAEPIASGPEPVVGPISRSLKVLLVDDDELVRDATQTLLELLGHEVTVAPSSEDALAYLDQGGRPQFVILDMNMPGLGGAGMLPRLRVFLPDLPVLLATGRVDQVALDLAEHDPHLLMMPKPFSLEELRHNLERLGLTT